MSSGNTRAKPPPYGSYPNSLRIVTRCGSSNSFATAGWAMPAGTMRQPARRSGARQSPLSWTSNSRRNSNVRRSVRRHSKLCGLRTCRAAIGGDMRRRCRVHRDRRVHGEYSALQQASAISAMRTCRSIGSASSCPSGRGKLWPGLWPVRRRGSAGCLYFANATLDAPIDTLIDALTHHMHKEMS